MPPQETPAQTAPASAPQGIPPNLATPLAIVIAGAFIALGIYFSGGGTPQVQQIGPDGHPLVTTKAQMSALIQKNRTEAQFDQAAKGGTERFIGSSNAPVTLVYWFDYQCPFCKQFEETVLPTLVQNYVNTGKLKIVFKDFPFLGNDSVIDSEYAQAVWSLYPEKFYDWHSAMFDVQDAEGDLGFGDATTVDTLTGLIPGIDAAKVKAAVQQNQTAYDAAINTERQTGTDNGVNGTPGFLVGKTSISGAQPLATFTAEIDKQLAAKGSSAQ